MHSKRNSLEEMDNYSAGLARHAVKTGLVFYTLALMLANGYIRVPTALPATGTIFQLLYTTEC